MRMQAIHCSFQNFLCEVAKCFNSPFKIVNKFLILVLAGAFLNQIADVLDDPGSLPRLLAESLPAMALFFTNFTMLQSLMGHALRLLRIGPLIVIHIKKKW